MINIEKTSFNVGRDLDNYSWIIVFYSFIVSLLIIYFLFVNKSLDGTLEIQLYSDTITYENYANQHTELELTELINVNYNYFGPVIIFKILGKNRLNVVFFNILILIYFFYSLNKILCLNKIKLLLLLCFNPIIFFSFLSLNKEILSFLFIIFFLKYISQKKMLYFILSIIFSLFVRWQLSCFFITYAILTSFLNPSYKNIINSIIVLIFFISIIFPILSSSIFKSVVNVVLESKGTYEGSGLFITSNELQTKGLYFLIMVPKLFHLLFGLLVKINPKYIYDDFWNNVIVTGQSIPFLYIFITIFLKILNKKINLFNALFFASIIYFIIFTTTPIYAPRYFVPVYILLSIVLSSRYQYIFRKD